MKERTITIRILIMLHMAVLSIFLFTSIASGQEGPAEGDARLYVVNVREDIEDDREASLFRVTVCDSTGIAIESLGVAPVEPDGSVFVLTPAGIPLQFEVLGRNGELLAKSARTYTLSPGEVRGLYRLNEPPGLAPPPPINKLMPDAISREPDILRPALASSGSAR